MKIGYARVSTDDQNLELQLDALNQYGVAKIYQEKMTSRKIDRPQLDEMLRSLREGDTVVAWKLDRIGRSLKHLIELIEELQSRGIGFVSLKENIDTTSATGRLMLHIIASFAEFERDMLSERTKAGLQAARARGKMGGRPAKKSDKVTMALKMYDSKEYTIQQIKEATGISTTTLYRYRNKRDRVEV